MTAAMDGHVAFVTGAALGAGAAIARALHGAGARVALASRTGTDLGLADSTCSACRGSSPSSGMPKSLQAADFHIVS